MVFKVVVADPETGKSYSLEARDPDARKLVGLRVSDKFDGSVVGLPGYELQITGGTDRDGFPMRADIYSPGRTSVLLASGPGFSPRRRGERRRKRVRGSRVSDAIVQVNTKIMKRGEKSLEEILAPKEAEAKPKGPEVEKAPPKKDEVKPEEAPKKPEAKPEEKPAEKPEEAPKEAEVKAA